MNDEEKYTDPESEKTDTENLGAEDAASRERSVKSDWKAFGKGMGRSAKNFGVALLRSVRAGIDTVDSRNGGAPSNVDKETLKNSWKSVGMTLGETAESLGKAIESTADSVFDNK